MMLAAFESFKKADKQDGGRCQACQKQIIKCGMELGDWKAAETAAEEMVEEAQGATNLALAHYEFGMVLMSEGLGRHKDEPYERAHDEMTKALAAAANFPMAVYNDGLALAHLNQDAAAKARFEQFVQDGAGGRSPPAAGAALCQSAGDGAGQDGAAVRGDHARRTTHLAGRFERQGGADRLLGHLVRSLPRGAAASAADCEEISGSSPSSFSASAWTPRRISGRNSWPKTA